MKNKTVKTALICLLCLCACVFSACGGSEYPTGAMTDDASLTLTWKGEEIVLDAVTLATLVTTELEYTTVAEDGSAEDGVSVVFDLPKYLAGEGWDLASCRTWVLTDRQGGVVFVPADAAPQGLYIGITDGAENLDYPVSVIPEGPEQWRVWELERIDFRPEKAEALIAEAERAAEAERQQQARDAVEGARHIALAWGVAGSEGRTLAQLIQENLAEMPAGEVTVLTDEEERLQLAREQALTATYSREGTTVGEHAVKCLTYGREALWLAGPVYPPALLEYCGMIEAEDYTFFAASGANVKLTPEQAEDSVILENEAGGLTLVYAGGQLDGVISVTAGRPVLEESL
ncbi:MAG: hypothetical protein J6T26_09460 [Firmicutes bacterium]|nr:hypothetical protein [Bacillota bacterium]